MTETFYTNHEASRMAGVNYRRWMQLYPAFTSDPVATDEMHDLGPILCVRALTAYFRARDMDLPDYGVSFQMYADIVLHAEGNWQGDLVCLDESGVTQLSLRVTDSEFELGEAIFQYMEAQR